MERFHVRVVLPRDVTAVLLCETTTTLDSLLIRTVSKIKVRFARHPFVLLMAVYRRALASSSKRS